MDVRQDPVTNLVWVGHVTAGLTPVIPFALAPLAINARSAGAGRSGSASAAAGNPSRLTSTTAGEFAAPGFPWGVPVRSGAPACSAATSRRAAAAETEIGKRWMRFMAVLV